MKKAIPFLLFMLAALAVHAQYGGEPAGFRHISVRNGLPSSEVYSIIQDNKGYVWTCTDAGVCRYNGFSFLSFTTRDGLTDNTVFRLREDKRGRIWAQGFSGAVSYFDGKRFNPVKANDSLVKIFSNGQNVPHFIETDSAGGIIVGGLYTNGCYRIGPEDNFTKVKRIAPKQIDKGYRITWSMPNQKAYTFTSFMQKEECDFIGHFFHNSHWVKIPLNPGANNPNNNRIIVTRDGRLLYSYEQHLYEISPDGTYKEYLFPKIIVGLDYDNEGNIWISLRYGGTVFCKDGDLAAPRKYLLEGKTVSAVCEDSEKGYWFSTVGEGLYYLPDLHIGYLSETPGYDGYFIKCIEPLSGGRIVIGSENNAVYVFDANRPDTIRKTEIDGMGSTSVDAIYVYHDTILVSGVSFSYLRSDLSLIRKSDVVGHSKGCASGPGNQPAFFFTHAYFYWFDAQNNYLRREPTPIRYTAAGYDQEGQLWFGSLNGLWKYENGKPVFVDDSVSGINSRIDVIRADKSGVLWIATRGEGIYAMDNDKLWHFTEKDGLASNICRAISIGDSGEIWIGTNRGVTMLSNFNRNSGYANFRSFNSTHGLLSDEIISILCHEGKLYMGSNKGLCWIDVHSLTKQTVRPPVYLTRILYGEDTIPPSSKPVFEFSDNTIRVFIEGLNFHDPEGLRYRYRLVGGSGEWITTANREISFSGLSPGDYRLEVFAVNSSGILSQNPVIFSFGIETPFYRSWWFILCIAFVLIGLAWGLASYRAHRLRLLAEDKAENERRIAELRLSALRAQMNPHFIFNAINSIQHFVLKNDSDQAYHYLSKFSKLIRLVLDQSQTDLIPISQEIKLLELYVELEQLRFERPFRYELNVNPELLDENVMIPGMLIQPYLENAIWHGLLPKKTGDAVVTVAIRKKGENRMQIIIADNGVGRKAASANKNNDARRSYGMLITEERLKLTKSKSSFTKTFITVIDLQDDAGEAAGTEISIILEL